MDERTQFYKFLEPLAVPRRSVLNFLSHAPIRTYADIPSYLPESTYWQVAQPHEVNQFIAVAQNGDWEAAVAGLTRHQREYWFSAARADFLSILPSRSFETILDLGCGAGSVTLALSERSGRTIGLDACLESLQILRLKAAHDGKNNVFPVHANATNLPFRDGSVDLILYNGVLERVGYAGAHKDVLFSQRQSLREAWRCLKPGGCLYIGIENRFGANYLLGARDEHTSLRWVNVMPRWLANLYSHLLRKKDFTAFTHSYWGLRGLLSEVGCQTMHFWCPLPTYRDPRLIIDLEANQVDLIGAAARVAPNKVNARLARLGYLIPSVCWRWIAPHYSLVAFKG